VEPGAQPKGAGQAAAPPPQKKRNLKRHFIREDFNGFAYFTTLPQSAIEIG